MIHTHPIRRRGRGFSLLEIIVALSVFMVGAASVFALFHAGARAQLRAKDMSNAARGAATIFAELEAKWTLAAEIAKRGKGSSDPYPVPAKGKPPWDIPGFPNYLFDVQYTPIDEDDNIVLATVIIFWERRGTSRSQTYKKVIRRKPF
jgi:prepilin-type N-terminal cleavage/methylation domain-containing protein